MTNLAPYRQAQDINLPKQKMMVGKVHDPKFRMPVINESTAFFA